ARHELAEPDGDVDEGGAVARPRLEQQHANGRVGGEPIGEHAAPRAGPHDHVVVRRSLRHGASYTLVAGLRNPRLEDLAMPTFETSPGVHLHYQADHFPE